MFCFGFGFVLFLHKKENYHPVLSWLQTSDQSRSDATKPALKPRNQVILGGEPRTGMISAAKRNNYRKPRKQKTGSKKKKKKKRAKERAVFANMTLAFCAAFFSQGCSRQKSFLLSSTSHLEKPSAASQPKQLFKFLTISLPTQGFVVVVCSGGVGSLFIFPAHTSPHVPAVLAPGAALRPLGTDAQPRTAGTAGARGGPQQWRAAGGRTLAVPPPLGQVGSRGRAREGGRDSNLAEGRPGKGGGRAPARCQIVILGGRAGAGGGAQVSLPAT